MSKTSYLKNSRLYLAVLYIYYFLSFQVVYQIWVTSVYGYSGYTDNFSKENFFISLLVLVVFVCISRNDETPSSIFEHLAIGLILVPSFVIYSGQTTSDQFIIVTCSAVALVIGSAKLIKMKRIVFPKLSINNLIVILFCASFFTIIGIFIFGGAKFLNFDIALVYDIRREAAKSIPGIFGYLNSIVTKVIIPFGMVLSLLKRRWIFMGLFLCMSVIFFALTAHKAPLFYPFVVLFFYYVAGHLNLKKYFILALLIGVILSGMDLWYFEIYRGGLPWIGGLFVNRALLVPAYLNSIYVDFFSHSEKYYWAFSKLSLGLVKSEYDLNASNLIGYKYFENSDMSANTGWIGSGYANAGYFGIALYSIFIGIMLSLLDAYAKKLSSRVIISLFVLPVVTMFTSSDLTDMLITNGLLVAIFILFIFDFHSGVKNNCISKS